jgi:hypothetical protein
VGGLNFAAAINAMEVQDAIYLDNWICTRFGLSIREGWYEHCNGLGSAIKSLLPWVGMSGVEDKLFAATNTGIYDVTEYGDTGPWTPEVVLSGAATSGTVHSINFAAAGRSYLIACSEGDGYAHYDPTGGWVQPTIGVGAGQIANVAPSTLVQVCAWKNRLWFVERNSTSVWYLPVLSVAGAAVEFDIGAQLKRGGTVVAAINWTMDAGTGIDDHLVFLGSEGDVVVYKGTDPASLSTFSLVGVWQVGRLPQGRRCFSQSGGDILVVSEYGLSPLSTLVKGGKTAVEADSKSFVSRIQEPLRQDVQDLSGEGWEVVSYESKAIMMINCPLGAVGSAKQYVLNTHSLRWSTFSNVPATTLVEFDGKLYFGTEDGQVCVALSGELDNVLIATGPNAGSYINCTLQTAFNYFETPGQLKRWLLVRPSFVGPTKPGVTVRMNNDFDTRFPAGVPAFTLAVATTWDTALWNQAVWAGQTQTYQAWRAVYGHGYAGSLAMSVVGGGGTRLSSIDYMVEAGGPL